MDADLLNVARTLAERGWLPGISLESTSCDESSHDEAVLHLAAHNECRRRVWSVVVDRYEKSTEIHQSGSPITKRRSFISEPGTTTLSLLRCLIRACEAAEKEKHDA